MSGSFGRLALAVPCLSLLVACSSAELPEATVHRSAKITSGGWQPVSSSATGTYEGVNGEGCSGGLKSGTQALGEQLKAQFGTTYGGYSCRANTANTSELSIHAVGRALDVTASGSAGDEIANYLVTNATTLGIQLIIWNHTLWKVTESGPTSRAYTGPNPHTDHVHAEVNNATAANGPGTVDGSGTATPSDPSDDTTTPASPSTPSTPSTPTGGTTTNPDDPSYPTDGNELECYSNYDCDPSGQLVCDQGYCYF